MPKFYTVKAVAEMFGMEDETIRCWLRRGDIFPHAFKVVDGWFIPADDIKKLQHPKSDGSETEETPKRRVTSKKSGFVSGWK